MSSIFCGDRESLPSRSCSRFSRGDTGQRRKGPGLPRNPWSRETECRSRPSSLTPPLLAWHTEGTTLEFIVRLHYPPRGRLRLPRPFARVMEVDKPERMWIRVHGCCNGAVHGDVEYPAPRVMFLRRGWKTFARAHNFVAGHVLRFKLVEVYTLFVKIYGHSVARLGYCEESSSDAESSSSSDNDEEDNVDKDGDSDPPTVKLVYDGSGSS
ncbi:l-ascorbate oxidase-like protein [Hordeum vulgare]|nr:l-ascorbate oxidase-like protein [Hordeum vulgare]